MGKLNCMVMSFVVLVVVAVHGVQGTTVLSYLSGSVFCDQCKDGEVTTYLPLWGMNVAMVCPVKGGPLKMVEIYTTDMFGLYSGTINVCSPNSNLSQCYIQLLPNSNIQCGSATTINEPKPVMLVLGNSKMALYNVDPFIFQPAKPMRFCSSPAISIPSLSPAIPVSPSTSTPGEAPLLEDTACPYKYWLKPEYKCRWPALSQDTNVALVFGPTAAKKYGHNLTFYQGLQGKGDPYKTLLRESITSLLNSYSNFNFPYNTLDIFLQFTASLAGSNRTIQLTALRFKRANYGGHGNIPCKLTPCKSSTIM